MCDFVVADESAYNAELAASACRPIVQPTSRLYPMNTPLFHPMNTPLSLAI